MIAIACSEAPEGYSKWTLQMIADKLVESKAIDSISAAAVGTTLIKANLSLVPSKSGVSQKREQSSLGYCIERTYPPPLTILRQNLSIQKTQSGDPKKVA